MFGDLLSPLHLVLLLIVALLVFGPRRLPELGGAVGRTIKEFQKSMAEARNEVQNATAAVTNELKAQPTASAQTGGTGATTQPGDGKPN